MLKSILDLFKYKQRIKELERANLLLQQKLALLEREYENTKTLLSKMSTSAFSYEDEYVGPKEGEGNG